VFKKIAYSLVQSLAAVHSRNNTLHRDVKPGNVLVGTESGALQIRLADFGSAVDDYSRSSLYDSEGPSANEQTRDYSPPETFFNNQPYSYAKPLSYDSFSLGVLLLEILLGQTASTIFSPHPKAEAVLRQQFEKRKSDGIRDSLDEDGNNILFATSLRITGFLKLCIAPVPRDDTTAVQAARGAIARGGGSGRGGFDPLCGGITGFRRALRELDAQASLRADKLFSASTGPESSSSVSASNAFALWNAGGTNGAIVSLRNKQASVAAFGEEALVPWHPPPFINNDPASPSSIPLGIGGAKAVVSEIYIVNKTTTPPPSTSRATASASTKPTSSQHVPFLDEEGEALLYQLLHWYPKERLSPINALQHDYFKSLADPSSVADDDNAVDVEDELL
jgi:serine/threonine protein kinase